MRVLDALFSRPSATSEDGSLSRWTFHMKLVVVRIRSGDIQDVHLLILAFEVQVDWIKPRATVGDLVTVIIR